MSMKIWVDADACPGTVKELIIRVSKRHKIFVVFVANKHIGIPLSVHIRTVRLDKDPEAVDEHIVQHAQAGDMVITQDIPLASRLVSKGVTVITPRGELHAKESIGERLSLRNFMQDIRDSGGTTPGPPPFTQKDKQRFSDTFDREITKFLKKRSIQDETSPRQ